MTGHAVQRKSSFRTRARVRQSLVMARSIVAPPHARARRPRRPRVRRVARDRGEPRDPDPGWEPQPFPFRRSRSRRHGEGATSVVRARGRCLPGVAPGEGEALEQDLPRARAASATTARSPIAATSMRRPRRPTGSAPRSASRVVPKELMRLSPRNTTLRDASKGATRPFEAANVTGSASGEPERAAEVPRRCLAIEPQVREPVRAPRRARPASPSGQGASRGTRGGPIRTTRSV